MKKIFTEGHTTMKRFLLPMVIAVAAISAVETLAQDVATRNLILRGANTTVGNIGTLTVTSLTAPRTYTLPDASGTILVSPNATLLPNRVLVTNNNGYPVTQDMTAGSLIIGKNDGTYAVIAPTGTRGLVVTTGNGTLDLALPTGVADAILRYDNSSGAWVASNGSTLDGTGNLAIDGSLIVDGNTTLGSGNADNVTIDVSNGASSNGSLTIAGLNTTGTFTDDVVMIDASNIVKRQSLANLIGGEAGITYNEANNGKMRLGGSTTTSVPLLGDRFINLNNNDLSYTTNGGGSNIVVIEGGVGGTNYGVAINAAGTGSVAITGSTTVSGLTNINAGVSPAQTTNIGKGGGTTNINGTVNVNTTAAELTNIGAGGGTANIRGTVNINTVSGEFTNIGVGGGTNVVLGTTNINATGTETTTIGNTGTLTLRGTTTNINTGVAATTTIGRAGGTNNIYGTNTIAGPTDINVSPSTFGTNIGNATGTLALTGTTITATGATTVAGTLTQTGSTNQVTFAGNVNADNGLDVLGASLTVGGSSKFEVTTAGNVTADGTLTVNGAGDFNSTLNVDGNTTLNANVTLGDASTDQVTITASTVTASNLPTTGSTSDAFVLSNAGALRTGTVSDIINGSAWKLGGNTGITNTNNILGIIDVNANPLRIYTNNTEQLTIASDGTATFVGNVNVTNGLDVTNADLTVGGTNFTVDDATGNTAIAGTLGVTGNTTIGGTLGVTGATTLSSTLSVTGDVAVNTNKFTVTAASGNTNIAGTLSVDGNTTLGSGNADNVSINVDNGANTSGNFTIYGLNNGSAADDVLLIDVSTDVVKRRSFSALIDGDNGVTYNEGGSGKMRLGGLNTTDVPFTGSRYINLNDNNLAFTTNNGGNTILALTGGTGGSNTGVTINATTGGSISLNGTTNITGATGITGNTAVTGTFSSTGNASFDANVTLGNASADQVTITAATVNAANLPSGSSDVFVTSNAGALETRSITNIVTGTGTANKLTMWTGSGTIGDASLSDNGSGTLSYAGNIAVNPGAGNTLSTNGSLSVAGDVSVNTNKFTVAGASGNTSIAGTLGVTGDVAVNTNKFTVAAASGNTSVAGTLNADGNTTLNANVTLGNASADAVTINAATVTASNLPTGTSDVFVTSNAGALETRSISNIVTGTGTANRLTMWTGSGTLGNASLSDDGTGTLSYSGNIAVNPGAGNTLSTNGGLSVTGDVAVNTNKFTVTAANGNTAIAGTVTIGGTFSDSDGNVIVADNIEPSVHDNYSLGTNTARWSDVYVGPATVHIGTTTVGGDELALSYNTNDNKAVFNVGSTDVMELTSAALTLSANLNANGEVTLGNGDVDPVTVNSTSGLTVNSSGDVDLLIEESKISRTSTLILQGADQNTPANLSQLTLDQNVVLESTAGGVSIEANAAMSTLGTTNRVKSQISQNEFAELYLTYESVAMSVNNSLGAVNPSFDVSASAGAAIANLTADEFNINAVSNFNDDMNVTGDAIFSGALTSTGAFTASGTMSITGALNVDGATTLNGTVTLGNGDADAVEVQSSGGLIINSGTATDLIINETSVSRDNTLLIQGTDGTDPTKISALTLDENVSLVSSNGGISLEANAAMSTVGTTNRVKSQISANEFSDVYLTYESVALTVNNSLGPVNPSFAVSASAGAATASLEADEFNVEAATNFNKVTTFNKAIKVATAVVAGTNAAYVADDDDFVIIQTEAEDVDFPVGQDGRMLIVKNTSGGDIDLNANGTDLFEGNQATIVLANATSNTFVFNNGVWYLIGN